MTLRDDPEPDTEEPTGPTTWTVAELGAAIGTALRATFPDEVWVQGEIRSIRPANRTGHQYFDLVEPGAEPGAWPDAKISVSLFRQARARVLETLASASAETALADGVTVRVRGRIDWWTGGGQLRLVMSAIDPVFTLGRLDEQRRALLAQLAAEGLLDANARLTVPPVPLRVGLVTSAGSAAHADFVDELRASRYVFEVVLADARVQGADAPRTLTAAITKLGAMNVDVIAVVRGGGSRTDLVAFDHPDVARAIARCPVPVFTGVGHEIDRSVADEVAHTACKTPTAAAATLVARVAQAEALLDDATRRLAATATRRLTAAVRELDGRLHRVARAAQVADTRARSHLGNLAARLAAGGDRRLRSATTETVRRGSRLATIAPTRLAHAVERLDAAEARLRASDPDRLLARGWSLTRRADGTPVRDATDVAVGDVLVTTLHHGTVTSTVTTTAPEENEP